MHISSIVSDTSDSIVSDTSSLFSISDLSLFIFVSDISDSVSSDPSKSLFFSIDSDLPFIFVSLLAGVTSPITARRLLTSRASSSFKKNIYIYTKK